MAYSTNNPSDPTLCAKCQASILEGQKACICCGEPVPREGLLSRFFKWLLGWGIRNGFVKIAGLGNEGQPVVRSQTLTSWDEVPPEVREMMEATRRSGSTVIRIRDDITGEDRTFSSWDEVPEHLTRNIPVELREQMQSEVVDAVQQASPRVMDDDKIVITQAKASKILDIKVNDIRLGD